MRNLNLSPSQKNPWLVFKAIRDAKSSRGDTRRILVELSERIRRRYQAYHDHRYKLERIPAAQPSFVQNDEEKRALEHCYETPTAPLRELLTCIRSCQTAIAQGVCQYCGVGFPGTFDHYLPSSLFPEFAVYARNLLPCCADCNSQRGACWLENGERLFLHLYFDEIEVEERFLFADIELDTQDEPQARFRFSDPAGDQNRAFGQRYRRHCDELRLLDRFKEAAPGELQVSCSEIRRLARVPTRGNATRPESLASHIAHFGQWLLGQATWRHRVVIGSEALAEKRRWLTIRLDVWERNWPLCSARLRQRYARALRRNLQRYARLAGGEPVPPSPRLDQAWSAMTDPRGTMQEMARQAGVASDFLFNELLPLAS